MGHFARVNNQNIVQDVIVADQAFIDTGYVGNPDDWIQTSYNTRGGIHYDPATGEPSEDQTKALRKNYAGIGYTYDPDADAFIPPKPYDSWILNTETYLWDPPTPVPQGDEDTRYQWNEQTLSWDPININNNGE